MVRRFWLVLIAQILLVAALPMRAAYTTWTGRSIVLQTLPVDPYSLLQGYSVALRYDISNRQSLEKLPGGHWLTAPAPPHPSLFAPHKPVYVILQAPADAATTPPQPWKPVAVQGDRPMQLPPNQVALRGVIRYGQIVYGLETYYIPEADRQQINDQISQIRAVQGNRPFVVEVKVGTDGQAVPVGFWVQTHHYQF